MARLRTNLFSIVFCLFGFALSCATRAKIGEGDSLFEAGDFSAARIAYENAAKENPDDAAIAKKLKVSRVFENLDMGRQLVFEDRYLEAFERFEEAMRIDPQNTTAPKWIEKTKAKYVSQKIARGFDLLAEEDYAAATESFQRALLYDARSENALQGLAKIREILDKRLAKADDYLLRGVRDKAANLIAQAAANFDKARWLNPADMEAASKGRDSRYRLAEQKFLDAQAFEEQGHWGAALVQYRAIRTIEPDYPGLAEKIGLLEVELKAKEILARGKSLLSRGDFEAARRTFGEAKKLTTSPETTEAIEAALQETLQKELSSLYVAGRGMEQAARFQEAVERYEAILKKTSFYEDTIARLDLARAALAKAMELYEKATKAEEAGDRAGALAGYQEIYAFYPKFRDVAERIERLKAQG